MIRKSFLAAVLVLLPALAQAQVKMLRHPSYSKGKVAFSYLGDIWIATENGADTQRLHTADAARPAGKQRCFMRLLNLSQADTLSSHFTRKRSATWAKICEAARESLAGVAGLRQPRNRGRPAPLLGFKSRRLLNRRRFRGDIGRGRYRGPPLLLRVLASFSCSLFLLLRLTVIRLGQLNSPRTIGVIRS